MENQLKVKVTKNPSSESVMKCRKWTIRERVFQFLFGKKRELVILIPSDRIQEVTINRKGEKNG